MILSVASSGTYARPYTQACVVIGDRLGLYKALATRPMTSVELAASTSTDERYVREWLAFASGQRIVYKAQP